MSWKRITTPMAAAVAAGIGLSNQAHPQDARPAPVPARVEAAEARAEGVTLSFTPVELPKRRSARAELDALERAQATLKVAKSLAVRTTRLPAGDYAVRVEQDAEKAYFLVIEPASAASGDKPAPATDEDAAASKKPPADGVSQPPVGEKREEKNPPPARTRPRERQESAEKPAGGGNGAERPAAVRLRVPVKMSACERKGDHAAFEVSLRSRGAKLRITFRAGETLAEATLRFGDPS